MTLDEITFHAGALLTGLVMGIAACRHRGDFYFVEEKRMNIASGNGLSQKIIKYFPRYKTVSPAVDHVAAGFGMPLIIGGIIGIFDAVGGSSNNLLSPYYICGGFYAGMEIFWDYGTIIKNKNRKYTLGDFLQNIGDAVGISAMLGTLHYAAQFFS